MTDLAALERVRMLAAEQAVIDSIPKNLRTIMDEAQRSFAERGGCPGCGSQQLAVHTMPCSELDKHPFD